MFVYNSIFSVVYLVRLAHHIAKPLANLTETHVNTKYFNKKNCLK